MKIEKKTGSFSSARGQEFNPKVEFPFDVRVIESTDELVALKLELTLAEQLKVRNAQEVTRARQAGQDAMLDSMGIEKQDANNNDQIRIRDMVKNLMTSPKYKALGREAAIAKAEDTLDIVWEGDRD